MNQVKSENKLVIGTMFAFGVSGAGSLALGSLIPFLRDTYGLSYDFAGMLVSLPGKKAGIGYNLAHGAYAIGALLSPLLVVACTGVSQTGWRITAAILAGLAIVQQLDYAAVPLPEETVKKSVKSIDRSFLKSKSFYLASAILFFYVSTEYAINGWMVTYFQDIGVLSDNMAQMMSSLMWLIMFIGRMIGASILGKVSRKALLVVDGVGLLGYDSIAAEMRDPQLTALVKGIGYTEGLRVVVDPGIVSPKAFLDEVVQQRLPNPFIPDAPQRIATDEILRPILGNPALFAVSLYDANLSEKVTAYFKMMLTGPGAVRKTLEELV